MLLLDWKQNKLVRKFETSKPTKKGWGASLVREALLAELYPTATWLVLTHDRAFSVVVPQLQNCPLG